MWPFAELARRHRDGALLTRFRARLGLTSVQMEHPDTRVPLQTAADLLTELVQETGTPAIGLVAAQLVTPEHLALPEYLARTKQTLGAALTASEQYAQLLCDGAHSRIELRDNIAVVCLWFQSNLVMPDAAYEFALATQLNCARRITGLPQLAPLEVHFMHSQPDDVTLHERIFNCRVRFNMPSTQTVLPARLLELLLPGFEPGLSRLLEQQANLSLAGRTTENGLVAQIQNLLVAELGLGKASHRRVAQRLGISTRTLARRLKVENTSYQELFDQTRRDLALRDLAETMRSIEAISKRLGFASSQSFHRAFRRWTGATANAYRMRAQLAEHSLAPPGRSFHAS